MDGNKIQWLKRDVYNLLDLIQLSTSSVAPTFSIAAAYGSMVAIMGVHAFMAVLILFPFFLFSSVIFRKLNKMAPHCGASYHWGTKFVGKKYGAFQFWIVTLAYFLSLPPIIIPAGVYTLDLLFRLGLVSRSVEMSVFWDSMVGIAWALISSIPLFLGAKPTARFTEFFLGVELSILVTFIGVGVWSLPSHSINQVNMSWFFDLNYFLSPSSFLRLAATMVIVATILDGWEIDSYAAEESKKPKMWPGLSGILGLVSVFLIYSLTMPIMTAETPTFAISSSVDPLARWASYVMPKYVFLMDIAVIASTASSLWLTSYILSRAWYSGAREGLMPKTFMNVHHKFGSPWVVVAFITIMEILVQLLELTFPSASAFFGIVLSSAGAFLLAEFGIDAITFTVVNWRKKKVKLDSIISAITALVMLATIAFGVIEAGPAFGISPIYYGTTILSMASIGLVFLWRSKKMKIIEFENEVT